MTDSTLQLLHQVVEYKWAARHEKEGQAVHDMLLGLLGMHVKSASPR